ncbi:hypothetical protein GCM10009843_06510 [Nocardioides bigeumensis]|uniref:Secreted protein n=1 Tax=Nocardioides bigeumensis TaxID=433657 RepID=A0ABN2XUG7_9ACTN
MSGPNCAPYLVMVAPLLGWPSPGGQSYQRTGRQRHADTLSKICEFRRLHLRFLRIRLCVVGGDETMG